MPSNAQRKKLHHRLWKKIRQIGGSNIEIENDPLGSRYQVNKFGIIVTADDEQVIKDIYSRLLALLKIECWEFSQSGSTQYVGYPPLAPVVAAIGQPHQGAMTQWRLNIGIH